MSSARRFSASSRSTRKPAPLEVASGWVISLRHDPPFPTGTGRVLHDLHRPGVHRWRRISRSRRMRSQPTKSRWYFINALAVGVDALCRRENRDSPLPGHGSVVVIPVIEPSSLPRLSYGRNSLSRRGFSAWFGGVERRGGRACSQVGAPPDEFDLSGHRRDEIEMLGPGRGSSLYGRDRPMKCDIERVSAEFRPPR